MLLLLLLLLLSLLLFSPLKHDVFEAAPPRGDLAILAESFRFKEKASCYL